MHYRRLKTVKRVWHLLLPVLPVALAVFLLVGQADMPRFLTSAGHTAATPFWHMRDSLVATVVATYESLENKDALLRENTALQRELTVMRRESFMARVLTRENERLRELLGRSNEGDALIPASVINGDTFSPYDSFVIDIGAQQGIRNHMLVITPEGLAIGVVTNTLKNSAMVTRFSAATMRVNVLIDATTTVHAILEGQGGGSMLISIPRDLHVSADDMVLLPNFSGNPLGSVLLVEMAPEEAYQTIYVGYPDNLYEMRYVLVDTVHTWQPEVEESGEEASDLLSDTKPEAQT